MTFDELLDRSHSLTDMERIALRALLVHGRGVESIAEELGISRAATFSLLDRAMEKLRREITERIPHHLSRSAPDWTNLNRYILRQNYPLKRAETLVDSLQVTVHGDEDGIVDFTRTLLQSFPEVETINRKPAENALGDVTLELRYRPPVPVAYARSAVEETARETGVILMRLGYSYVEP